MMTQERKAEDNPASSRTHSLLIVDDQEEVLTSLRRTLRNEPYDIRTLSSPADALEWITRNRVDLLIADERMPEMRGSDLLDLVRDRSPETIRVILTGYPGSSTVAYGLAHGVNWLISKPWNDDALKLTIRQLLADQDKAGRRPRGAAGPKPSDPAGDPTRLELKAEVESEKKTLRETNEELLREIADRRRAEEIARLSEMRFRLLVEGVKDYAILMLSPEGIVVSWNDGAERINGYAAEEILGRHFSMLYPAEDLADGKPERLLKAAVQEGRVEDEGWRLRKDGTRFWSNVVLTPIRDSDGQLLGYSKLTRDMTERRKAEEEKARLSAQMLQGQKLQAIGQLSAGIAHEINNPVGYILSNLNTMGEYCQDIRRLLDCALRAAALFERGDNPAQALIEFRAVAGEIDAAHILNDLGEVVSDCKLGGERIRDIVRSLREFSHVDEAELKPTDLNKCLEDALRICWNELKYKAEVHKDYGTLPPVPCYAQRLGQVFINLLVNAGQAIEKRGELFLSTRVEGGEVVIRIRDTGRGIEPENLRKIFEPFFTTKSVGTGTGLGLHVAYKIVLAHGGSIGVDSKLGAGTEFQVRLPLAGPRGGKSP